MGKKINFKYIAFLSLIALGLALLQFSFSGVTDPDSYYHIKFSEVLSSQGWSAVSKLPWVEFSVWKNFPADLSLGYHYLLTAFFNFSSDPIIAAKILGVFVSSVVFAVFLAILLRLKIRQPLFWLFLLFLGSSAFLYRLIIIRPVIFSIIFLLLGFLFAFEKRRWALCLTALFHSLIHASTVPFLIFVVAVALFFKKDMPPKKRLFLFFSCVGGAFLGLILRPDFPFIFYQLVFQDWYVLFYQWQGLDLGQGKEIHSSGLDLYSSSFLVLLIFLSAIFASVNNRWIFFKLKLNKNYADFSLCVPLLIISLIFLLFSVLSFRFIDYWTPFALLFAALAAKPFFEQFDTKVFLWNNFKKHRKIAVFISLFIILLITKNIIGAYSSVKATESLEKFQAASIWLKENTPENSVIFHTDWDDFPKLFYYNDHNRYLVGLDPTFMYEYNKDLYWLWRNISDYGIISDHPLLAEEKENYKKFQNPEAAAQAINNKFNSNVIFVPKERVTLNEFLLNNPDQFGKAYEDQWADIYKIK